MAGELLAIGTAITFPLANAFFKKVDHLFTPAQINAIRLSIGAISFIIFILIFDQWKMVSLVGLSLLIVLLISVFFGQVIGDTAYFTGQESLGTTIALAISGTMPFFTFILSTMAGKGRRKGTARYFSPIFWATSLACVSYSARVTPPLS